MIRCSRCGALAAAIQGAFGLGTSALNNAVNAKIAKETNATNVAMNAATNAANMRMNAATNATNKQIADDANALNLRMFQEQNEWNENMWEKQNEYNDPSNQMARLVAAGINPNMVAANGNNPSGNSEDLPQSAQFVGAQMATMNPSHIEPGHVDPYQVAFENPDMLEALATAAGIAKTQAETEGINIDNKFKPEQYGDIHEMRAASTQQIQEQVRDFIAANAYRMSQRRLDIAARRYEVSLVHQNEIAMKLENRKRKAEFKEWNDLAPARKSQIMANLSKTFKEIETMDAQQVQMKALEKHWINQDSIDETNAETNRAAVDLNRKRLQYEAVDYALKSAGFRLDTRQKLASALLRNSDLKDVGSLVKALDGAADGNYNTWLNAAMHSSAGDFLNRLFDGVPNNLW